ncbi:MAG: glycosyltransferase family 2 protein [Candidatus Sericytochromatia bacterium]
MLESNIRVDILLATYNGEKYLEEQLDSIINQTYKNWFVIVRDDGSSDLTLNIIEQFCKNYPDKSLFIKDSESNLGPCFNFGKLLTYSTSNYIMFCDQDDIWLENKIELSLSGILKTERIYSKDLPILIHTDLKVVDSKLNMISESFFELKKLNPELSKNINSIICDNSITGCTMIINKSLKDKIIINNKNIIMHDWWIAIIACILGKIDVIYEPTILYRQHSNNSIGISNNKKTLREKLKISTLSRILNYEEKIQNQTKSFLDVYEKILNIDRNVLNILSAYSKFSSYTFFKKKYIRIKYSFFYRNFIKNLILLLIN